MKPVNHRHVPVCSVDIMRGKLDAEELGIITRTSFMDEFFHEDEIASPSQFILYHYNGLPRSCPHGKVSIEHSPPLQLHPSSPLSSPKPHCLHPLNPTHRTSSRSVCNTALLPTLPPSTFPLQNVPPSPPLIPKQLPLPSSHSQFNLLTHYITTIPTSLVSHGEVSLRHCSHPLPPPTPSLQNQLWNET